MVSQVRSTAMHALNMTDLRDAAESETALSSTSTETIAAIATATSTVHPTQSLTELSRRPRPQLVQENVLLDETQRKQAFDRIFRDNFWGNSESRSGYGSMISYTGNALLGSSIPSLTVCNSIGTQAGRLCRASIRH